MSQTILFIGGSLNQTTMMHAIARHLSDHHCFFTPFYADDWLADLSRIGALDFTILGGAHRRSTEQYLAQQRLPVDFGGASHPYDLVVTCTDVLVQKNLRGKKIVLVQEGMMEPAGLVYHLVRNFSLPRYLANTSVTGLSGAYDVFCVASPGYRDLFMRRGADPRKIVVTGIPNFDHARAYLDNDFAQHGFVLAATSCARETFKWDDRLRFIARAREIAAGRPLIFKLHPNENIARACDEIRSHAPEAAIYVDGNVHHMIANCEVLITQYSSAVFTGIALGKEVYSYLDIDELRQLAPIQNGGTSAYNISEICRDMLHKPRGIWAYSWDTPPAPGYASANRAY